MHRLNINLIYSFLPNMVETVGILIEKKNICGIERLIFGRGKDNIEVHIEVGLPRKSKWIVDEKIYECKKRNKFLNIYFENDENIPL